MFRQAGEVTYTDAHQRMVSFYNENLSVHYILAETPKSSPLHFRLMAQLSLS